MNMATEELFAAQAFLAMPAAIRYFHQVHRIPNRGIDSAISPIPTLTSMQFGIPEASGSSDLKCVHVPNVLAFPVAGAWSDKDPRSLEDDLVFEGPTNPGLKLTGTLLVAHNGLAGTHFYALNIGDEVHLIFRNGSLKSYRVTEIKKFQVSGPGGRVYKDITGQSELSWSELLQTYLASDEVVFMTCLPRGFHASWGRLVVIAAKDQ